MIYYRRNTIHSLKKLEELQLKTSDIGDILPKRIAEYVELAARETRYGRQLLRPNNQLLDEKGRSVHLPKRGTITVDRLSEAITPTEQKVTWSTVEVTPFKLGTFLHMTQESIDGAEIDVINGSLQEAGEAMADKEDVEIFNELLGRQPDPVEAAGKWTWTEKTDGFTGDGTTKIFTLTESPVIEMSTVTVGGSPTTAYKVDYYDAKVEFTVAPASGSSISIKYWYSKLTNYVDASTIADFKLDDIVAANIFFRSKKQRGNVMVIHPNQLGTILKDSTFIDAGAYGDREPILNGEIGKISGFKVLERYLALRFYQQRESPMGLFYSLTRKGQVGW